MISSSGNRSSKENTNYREANKTITPPRGRNANPTTPPPAGAAPGCPRSGLHGLKAAKGAGLGSRTQYCPLPGHGDKGRHKPPAMASRPSPQGAALRRRAPCRAERRRDHVVCRLPPPTPPRGRAAGARPSGGAAAPGTAPAPGMGTAAGAPPP